jgi:DNA-binding transcriptional LysR family regulator
MSDWDDIRYFLAVARSGSTLAAARDLRVSQATISRRVSLFEERLGIELFSRSPAGYALTARGAALVPLAEAVEAAAGGFHDAVGAESRRVSGKVRLTTIESAANAWVIPALARLAQSHPGIEVEVVTSDHFLDLARGEADVAIRFGAPPSDEALVARKLTELEECLYASREMVTRLGRPASFAEVARYPLVGDTIGQTGWFNNWIEANIPGAHVAHRVQSISGIVAAVRAGLGAAILPTIMGDDIKGLVRLLPPIKELTMQCWMVTTDQARRQPHVRAVIDAVVAVVEMQMDREPRQPAVGE